MENAADALKMAAAILVFIIAIGSSFSLFGTAKQTADSIITMRDKQAYLDAAELDNGILYTSTESITSGNMGGSIGGINDKGHRIVGIDDVISTILRYNKEKYGVTIIENKKVLVRFDSNTENVMRQWYNIVDNPEIGKTENEIKADYISKIKSHISTDYCKYDESNPNSIDMNLEELYEITGHSTIHCGAPWYGNDEEIQKRITHDLAGTVYEHYGQKYTGKNLTEIFEQAKLHDKDIIEVTNEIDQSKYLKDGTEETNLLQQYEMPTVEIVYIIQ